MILFYLISSCFISFHLILILIFSVPLTVFVRPPQPRACPLFEIAYHKLWKIGSRTRPGLCPLRSWFTSMLCLVEGLGKWTFTAQLEAGETPLVFLSISCLFYPRSFKSALESIEVFRFCGCLWIFGLS